MWNNVTWRPVPRHAQVQRKVLGDCHPHSVATLQNLAALYAAKGDVAKGEAMQMLVQALQQSTQPGAVVTQS